MKDNQDTELVLENKEDQKTLTKQRKKRRLKLMLN